MTKRTVGGMLLGFLVSVTAAIASCSFPSYEIIVTGTSGSAGGATASASSGGGGGGNGGASSTVTTGSGTGGSGGSSASTSSASSSSTGDFDAGACPIDEDNDGFVSWQCPGGKDCADQDSRANPNAGFIAGLPIKGLKQPATLPYDFNCMAGEEKQTLTLNCTGVCLAPSAPGFQKDVECGAAGALGHCEGLACAWVSDSKNLAQLCK